MSMLRPMTLVLLPGMHGRGQLFAPLLRELPEHIRTLVVSYPTDKPMNYLEHLDIIMAALPLDEPFVLLGESFSGPLALMTAARKPKGLRGVILCATFVNWPLPFPAYVALLIVSFGLFRLKSQSFFVRLLLGKNASAELITLFSEAMACTKPEVLAARARAVIDVNCTVTLRDCQFPLLAMIADNDRIIAKSCSQLIQHIRPDAEIVHFESPHLILQCNPTAAAKRICQFMELL